MTPSRRTLWAWLGAMPLAAILVPAGGLGLAPLAGLFVTFSLPARQLWAVLRQPGPVLILSALALGWFCLSHFWSPYQRVDELLKLALLTPLFVLVPLAARQLEPQHLPLARTGLVFAIVTIFIMMAAEALTRGDVTFTYKVDVEGYEGTRETIQSAVHRTLSRGATPALMFGGVMAVMLWTTGRPALRALAVATGLISIVLAFDFNVRANGVSFITALIVCALALRWPRMALPVLLWSMAALIVLTPPIFLAITSLTGDTVRAALPGSWEWRLEIWAYALSRIAEQPLTGHGLGAARVINTETELRGWQIELLPLHAHNAGLTIWLETGFAGALLAATALVAAGRALMRKGFNRALVVMLCWVITIWFVNVTLSYSIWREWHHAALAWGTAFAMIAHHSPRPAGNLR